MIATHIDASIESSTVIRIRLAAAGFTAAAGAVVLIGWATDQTTLTQIIPGMSAMNPLSAMSFLVAGAALALHSRAPAWCISALGGVIFAIGAAKLTQLALGFPHGVDELLFAAQLDHAIGVPRNQMAPNTAIAFVLTGLALVMSRLRSKNSVLMSQILAMIVFALALFAIIGYILGQVSLYSIKSFNPMALHSAITLIATAVGVLSCNPECGLMKLVGDRGPAGQLARRMLPLAILIPVAVALLRLKGEALGYFGIGDAIALQVFANVIVTFFLLSGGILVLYRSDLDRQHREFLVQRSEEGYRLAEEMGRVGHWRHDLNNDEMGCSAEFATICGLPSNSPPSQEMVIALYHPADADRIRELIAVAIDTGVGWDTSARIIRPDGELRHISSFCRCEKDDRGNSVSLFGVIVDITELELSRQKAEAAMDAKAAFLANMSHEIRTPLNSIIGFTDLILDDPSLAPNLKRQLDLVKNSGDALLTVVNDILDFSKMEAGKTVLVHRGFNLRHLLQNTMSIIGQTAESKGLTVELSVNDDIRGRHFIGDEDRLRQIILNLLSNAVKFTALGRVVLAVAIDGPLKSPEIKFSVTDTGPGIPKDQEVHLFKQFSQTDTKICREQGGTGLGLAISKSLVTLMGGKIGYLPTAEGGSQFWFQVQLQPTDHAEADADVERPTQGAPLPMRILVVEDLAVNQELATAMLTRSGHRVEVVENGKEAIAAVQKQDFDLILMDIQMPVMDGLTATRLIRLLPGKSKTLPIIALSANVLPEQIEFFREAGMTDHLMKPIKLNSLNEAIARHTSNPQTRVPANPPELRPEIACFDKSVFEKVSALLRPERVKAHLETFTIALEDLSRSGLPGRELQARAHQVAGQAGMFGFMALSDLCRQVETEVCANRPCVELLSHVREAITQVQPTIAHLQFKLAA